MNSRGQVPAFEESTAGLGGGLLLSILVIFLLLAANVQSFRLALAVVSAVPAVICGAAAADGHHAQRAPIALGTGERAQTAPLGRAVIGGLFMATLATLVVLPAVYTLVQARVRTLSPTLHPDDPASKHHDPTK